jgi:hypothetical protein
MSTACGTPCYVGTNFIHHHKHLFVLILDFWFVCFVVDVVCLNSTRDSPMWGLRQRSGSLVCRGHHVHNVRSSSHVHTHTHTHTHTHNHNLNLNSNVNLNFNLNLLMNNNVLWEWQRTCWEEVHFLCEIEIVCDTDWVVVCVDILPFTTKTMRFCLKTSWQENSNFILRTGTMSQKKPRIWFLIFL